MSVGSTDYVTVLAGNYMQPLGLMIEKLVSQHRQGLPSIKANEHETDWAISAILIAVVMFEGWLMRVRYEMVPKPPTNIRHSPSTARCKPATHYPMSPKPSSCAISSPTTLFGP